MDQNAKHAEVWLLPEDVATMLGVELTTLRKWRETETGPAYRKMGTAKNSQVRYPEHLLQEWKRQQPLFMPAGNEQAA